jgi:type II secretory pathway pseudopilin PulG
LTCPRCQMVNPPGTAICASCGFAIRGARAAGGGGQRKGLAIASVVLGVLSLFTFAGLLIGGTVGLILGIVALVKANGSPATHGGKGLAIAGIVISVLSFLVIPVIGIIAAIAIPSLLRARTSANESMAIGDIRTVISGEAAYQSSNAGQYDTLECLAAPSRCIPNYPANGPTFIDSQLTQAEKTGYRRSFHPGPASDPAGRGTSYSPSSITAYAYVAEPIKVGQTGLRAFCGDDTGVVCQTMDGRMPPAVDGHCPSECSPLY